MYSKYLPGESVGDIRTRGRVLKDEGFRGEIFGGWIKFWPAAVR